MDSVTLDRIIPAEELLSRWPGLIEEELAGMLNMATNDGPVLRAYWHDKTLITPEKKRIHICRDCVPEPHTHRNGDTTYFDWGGNDVSLGIVCDLADVEQIEKLHPECFYQVARNGEQFEDFTEPDVGYWENCESLADRWECSPLDVVKAIKEKGLNLDAQYENTWFQHDTLDNFSVHSVDLARFEHEHAEYLESFKSPTSTTFEAFTPVCPKPPLVDAEVMSQSGKRPAVVKDYTERMPDIVGAVLAIKAEWDKKGENSQVKTYGFSEREIQALAPDLSKRLRVAVKKALNNHGVKVWLQRGQRPSV